MQAADLIIKSAKEYGVNPDQALSFIHNEVKNNGALLLKSGDTMVFFERMGQGVYEAHLFTEDKPVALAKAVTHIIRDLKERKAKRIYGKATNQQIINVIRQGVKRVGGETGESDRPEYNWMVTLWAQ